MFVSRSVLSATVLVGVLFALAACGGGSAGSFNDALDTPDNSFAGITEGEFKAVRFNEAGSRDAALNPTLGLTTRRTGGFTEVTIVVNDTGNMLGVTLELDYDSNRFHPVGNQFLGLVDSPIEAYIPNRVGTVSLGQVAFETATRSGKFATVRFADGPATSLRNSSVTYTNWLDEWYDAPQLDPANFAQGFVIVENEDGSITATANSIFAQGDGDDNSETNIADLSSLVIQGNFGVSVSDTNFGPAATDYDRNGEVNLADIAMIALNYQAHIDHIDFMVSDNADMSGATVHEALAFAEGSPADRLGLPFATASWDMVWRTWTSTFSGGDISAADTNFDGQIFVSARVSDGTVDGWMFVPGWEVLDLTRQISITGVDVTYAGLPLEDGAIAEVVANSSDTWDIVGIAGIYDEGSGPVAFTAADAGTLIPQSDYDKALGIVRNNPIWTVTNLGGDADFKSTGPALFFESGGTGVPVISTAFPDWDPESVAPMPEASLELSFSAEGGNLVTSITPLTFGIDAIKDPAAPELGSSMTDHGLDVDGNWILSTSSDTSITSLVSWGTTAPATFTDVQVELFPVKGVGESYLMKYTAETVPAAGEFTIVGDFVKATTAPMAAGGQFALRISNTEPGVPGVWSSVNLPGVWFSTDN